mmetsp:Transcript_106803/g.284155  ORF Transcript_106803/g.284155 Transcript_106803/m.284155 type:complete len:417 (+) Transcript_106803:36-1286(+)
MGVSVATSPKVAEWSVPARPRAPSRAHVASAAVPARHLRGAVGKLYSAFAMLLPRLPEALVLPAVGPYEDSEAVLRVGRVLAAVLLAIWPSIGAQSMDDGILPRPHESAAVVAVERAFAVDCVGVPRPMVLGLVWPVVDAVAVLVASDKLALVSGALAPDLDAIAVLQVIAPLAVVARQVLGVVVDAQTVGQIPLPLASVGAAVRMDEAPTALGAVLVPLALVHGAVLPHLLAEAMPLVPHPLAGVNGARLKDVGWPGFLEPAAAAGRGQARQLLELLSEIAARGQLLVLVGVPLVLCRTVRRVVAVPLRVGAVLDDRTVRSAGGHLQVRFPLVRAQASRPGKLLLHVLAVLLAALLRTGAGGALTHATKAGWLRSSAAGGGGGAPSASCIAGRPLCTSRIQAGPSAPLWSWASWT